jgi:hypothetical protein
VRLCATGLLALLLACSGDQAARDGGLVHDAGPGLVVDADDAPATARAPQSCLDVRNCVQLCKDAACAAACVSRAPTAAQASYRAVDECSRRACADRVMECRCAAECIFPGDCTGQVDECNGGMQDRFCDLCF